jgi:hypothetical protein
LKGFAQSLTCRKIASTLDVQLSGVGIVEFLR